MSIVLATTNFHKVNEILKIWEEIPFSIFTLKDFPEIGEIEENGNSFAENALIKAHAVSQKTGFIAIADDSGLEIDVLQGRPGVYSARYAGQNATDQENIEKVLQELRQLPIDFTLCTARFRCVAALVEPSGKEITTEGALEGLILPSACGLNGFGYDPIFYVPSEKKTLAEMGDRRKNQISHRFQAFEKMRNILLSFL